MRLLGKGEKGGGTWECGEVLQYLSASTDIKVWTVPLEKAAKLAMLSISDLLNTRQVIPALNLQASRPCK